MKKKLYKFVCEDEVKYLKLTKAQAKFVDEIVDFLGYCDCETDLEEFEMPTKANILEIEED